MSTFSIPGFHGDASWVHRQEGHSGSAYWPGGASGVTLDPGFDLGAGDWNLFEQHYAPLLTEAQRYACRMCRGVQGASAKALLRQYRTALTSIRISRARADELFPLIATPFWKGIVARFPRLAYAPPGVQTAMLSLAYNRGVLNKGLAGLGDNIGRDDWKGLAREIHAMQQLHVLPGIRRRRRAEARLIDATLKP